MHSTISRWVRQRAVLAVTGLAHAHAHASRSDYGLHGSVRWYYFATGSVASAAVRAGNYPWPSSYIAGSAAVPMPAWPMQHACAPLAVDLADTSLLQAMREAVGVLYNHTEDVPCYELPSTLHQRRPLAQGAAVRCRARRSMRSTLTALACRWAG